MISENKIHLLSQLLNAMNDSAKKMEEYYRKKDIEKFSKSKEEMLNFQGKVSEILNQK